MIPLAFLTASIIAEIDDLESRLPWTPDLPSQLRHIARVRKLLAEIEKHCEPDAIVRESLVRDDEPTASAERDQRTEES